MRYFESDTWNAFLQYDYLIRHELINRYGNDHRENHWPFEWKPASGQRRNIWQQDLVCWLGDELSISMKVIVEAIRTEMWRDLFADLTLDRINDLSACKRKDLFEGHAA